MKIRQSQKDQDCPTPLGGRALSSQPAGMESGTVAGGGGVGGHSFGSACQRALETDGGEYT